MQASLEGWNYAFAHPDETLDIVLNYMREAKLPASRMHQKWMLDQLHDLIMPKGNQKVTGDLTYNDYKTAGHILLKAGEIQTIPDFNAFMGRLDDAHQ